SVEQLSKNLRDLRLDDPRAVVLDRHHEALWADLSDLHKEVGQNPSFLTGVQRVVHSLFHSREQSLRRTVEAQQVAVLGEEFGDGNFALARGHLPAGRSSDKFWTRC